MRLMTCLQLRRVPDSPLRQALLNASLDKNTNVEYNNVSLNYGDTKGEPQVTPAVAGEPKLTSSWVSHTTCSLPYLTFTTPISSLETNRSVKAFRRKVRTRNITCETRTIKTKTRSLCHTKHKFVSTCSSTLYDAKVDAFCRISWVLIFGPSEKIGR